MAASKPVSALSHPEAKVKENSLPAILIDLALLFLSAFLFAFSFPSGISTWGLFPLGFIALVPLFILVHRSNWISIFIYGLLFGFASYSIFNFWLVRFHPLAIFIVPTIYALFFLLLLPLLKLADVLFPKKGYLVQLTIWIGYEYLKTTGFLGYPYGIMGYTQYLFRPLIGISSITGVWGVSFLVIAPSVFLGNALKRGTEEVRAFFRKNKTAIIIYTALFAGSLLFGFIGKVDLKDPPSLKVALVQHNVDPWKNDYEESLRLLTRLSEEAMKRSPELVVWPETAFIPAIEYHTKHRTNKEAYRLVKELTEYLEAQNVPFVIGNDDGVLKRLGGTERIDYNASLLFDKGTFRQKYRKTHLVPFTEHFPFQKQLPGIHKLLLEADTHFWEKGDEYTVFQTDKVSFSTPICFEDCFGYLSREFVQNGAELIVNMSNDLWSHSIPSEMQHMAMSVFRAVENRRSVVRSTNGGITCTIDPNGKITSLIDPFIESYLVSDVPVYTETTTLYTRWGDWFGKGAVYCGVALLIFGLVLRRFRNRKGSKENHD